MRENIRRIVLFVLIVVIGTFMIVIGIPLIPLILLMLAVVFLILVLVGTIKVADLRRYPLLKQLDDIRFFEKKKAPAPSPPPREKRKTPAQGAAKVRARPAGLRQYMASFVSSLRSIRKPVRNRTGSEKHVDDFGILLDKTLPEKVKGSALASAGMVPGIPGDRPGGAGSGEEATGTPEEANPFLSLSTDEMEIHLIDDLYEPETTPSTDRTQAGAAEGVAEEGAALDLDFPDLELPPLPEDAFTDKGFTNAEGFTELHGHDWAPEWVDNLDVALAELESISIMDVNLDDDDVIGSLTSGIIRARKEKDISLLRDLEEFTAPVSAIENELQDLYDEMIKAPRHRRG